MAAPNQWSTSLYGCFDDCGICLYGYCCLPCLYGDNVAKATGGGSCGPCCLYTCCPGFACIFAGGKRTEIRNKYNLPEEPCSDCCVHFWCSPCGVCQEARQLKGV
ncbi:hypothetical protein BSKO_08404 [Bryopsis sp. KO-2023]|nr:hypothetical protein BSKO_08404 [Bryopsis sp. KO-2023]